MLPKYCLRSRLRFLFNYFSKASFPKTKSNEYTSNRSFIDISSHLALFACQNLRKFERPNAEVSLLNSRVFPFNALFSKGKITAQCEYRSGTLVTLPWKSKRYLM